MLLFVSLTLTTMMKVIQELMLVSEIVLKEQLLVIQVRLPIHLLTLKSPTMSSV